MEMADWKKYFPDFYEGERTRKTSELLFTRHLDYFLEKEFGILLQASQRLSEQRVLMVNVKPSKDGLNISTEGDVDHFFHNLQELPKTVLVYSKSISVIEAKLAAYREFRHEIDGNKIQIRHELDEYWDFLDDNRFICVHYLKNIFQEHVESLLEKVCHLGRRVEHIVKNVANHVFSRENIRKTCTEVCLTDKDKFIGTMRAESYVCRSHFTVKRIKKMLVSNTLRKIGDEFCGEMVQCIIKNFREILEVSHHNLIRIISNIDENIHVDLQNINLSISEDTFMNYNVIRVTVVKIVAIILSPIVGLVMAVIGVVFTFVWSVDVNSPEWRNKVADEIYDQVEKKKESIVSEVSEEMKRNIEQDIIRIAEKFRSRINGFERHNTITENLQRKQIDEWMLRDTRIIGMEKHPTILKMICGRVDDTIRIKVFLASVDEKMKDFVKKNIIGAPSNAEFIFVDITSLRKNQSKLKEMEAKACPIDQQTGMKLHSIIENVEDELFAMHSNIIAIGTSPLRQVGKKLIKEPCIVIYCLDKELVPFGEERLPDQLNGVPCDIREDFLHLGTHTCTDNSHKIVHGCSIGSTQNGQMGSVGFLARENTNSKSGFLTAAHVAVSSEILGDLNEMQSTEIPDLSENGPIHIIHLFKRDGSILSERIGEVTKSFFGNHGHVGIDAAFVKFTDEQEETLYKQNEVWDKDQHFSYPIESNVVRREDVNVYGNLKVYKRGIATGVTEGRLNGEASVKIPHPLCEKAFIIFKKCFQIEFSDDDKGVLFDQGDSGSGVFLLIDDARLQPLAIAFSILTTQHAAIASPLENILSTLDVSI